MYLLVGINEKGQQVYTYDSEEQNLEDTVKLAYEMAERFSYVIILEQVIVSHTCRMASFHTNFIQLIIKDNDGKANSI